MQVRFAVRDLTYGFYEKFMQSNALCQYILTIIFCLEILFLAYSGVGFFRFGGYFLGVIEVLRRELERAYG
jgi:hypothetical protein